jgi:hypothetical protein
VGRGRSVSLWQNYVTLTVLMTVSSIRHPRSQPANLPLDPIMTSVLNASPMPRPNRFVRLRGLSRTCNVYRRKPVLLGRPRANMARTDASRRFEMLYPDRGQLRRELYSKHIEFFAASADFTELAIIGANRSGETTAAAYAMTAHLTGRYPSWWRGRRFERPIAAWVTGVDAKSSP